jgi:hypothetical protein
MFGLIRNRSTPMQPLRANEILFTIFPQGLMKDELPAMGVVAKLA